MKSTLVVSMSYDRMIFTLFPGLGFGNMVAELSTSSVLTDVKRGYTIWEILHDVLAAFYVMGIRWKYSSFMNPHCLRSARR